MKKYSLLLLLSLMAVVLPGQTQAASLFLQLDKPILEIGQQYELKVMFDRQTDAVNGLEGQVVLPISLLSDVKIKDGGSAISMWVQAPKISLENGAGAVTFSAISPAGINGYLFSILFTAPAIGHGQFEFQGNMLMADGKGTRKTPQPQILPVSFVPSTSTLNIGQVQGDFATDHTLPENFQIFVARDPKIFSNQWFAAFNAQDKDSGIAFYEALETDNKNKPESQLGWQKTTSPYILKDQSLTKYLFVKAVDRNGNYRISSWQNPSPQASSFGPKYKFYVIMTIIILLLLGLAFELYLRRHKKQNIKF